MTHHSPDGTTIAMALELLTEHGLEGVAPAVEILINQAMEIERSAFLQAAPHERTEDRRGYANGFREKHMKTRLGELELRIPRVRDLSDGAEGFYPKALERGERSERALKLAIAQMYVEGVSTRKVTEITRELCGLDVTSSQVSRAAKLLDEEIPHPRRALQEGPPRRQRARLRRPDGQRRRYRWQAVHPWHERRSVRSRGPSGGAARTATGPYDWVAGSLLEDD